MVLGERNVRRRPSGPGSKAVLAVAIMLVLAVAVGVLAMEEEQGDALAPDLTARGGGLVGTGTDLLLLQ